MKNLACTIFILLFSISAYSQLTVDTSNGNVGIKDSSPEDALTVAGNISHVNFGTRYYKFSNLFSGGLSSNIDKNGFRWEVPNQELGPDSIRMYQLYNYGEDKLFFDNNADFADGVHMTIKQTGEVGIGTDDPLSAFHLKGDALFDSSVGKIKFGYPTGDGWGLATTGGGATLYFYSYANTSTEAGAQQHFVMTNTGRIGIGTSSPDYPLHVQGDMGISGQIFGISDKRVKTNIESLVTGLEKIAKMNPVSYFFKTDVYPDMNLPEGRAYGLLAQELEEFFPELVGNQIKTLDTEGEEMNLKSVNYIEMIPVLISAVKELNQIVEDKDREIKALEKRMSALEAKIK